MDDINNMRNNTFGFNRSGGPLVVELPDPPEPLPPPQRVKPPPHRSAPRPRPVSHNSKTPFWRPEGDYDDLMEYHRRIREGDDDW